MDASALKYHVEASGYTPFFYTRKNMRFFGDTMKNYGVRDAGDTWELYRRRPVAHGLKNSVYFDKKTFKRVFPRGIGE